MGNVPEPSVLKVPESPQFNVSGATVGRRNKFSAIKRSFSQDDMKSDSGVDPWGWFEDIETESPSFLGSPHITSSGDLDFTEQPLHKALSLPAPATVPPLYILESNLETQQLWYSTAGRRPKQPKWERDYFEKIWTENFEASNAKKIVCDNISDSEHQQSEEPAISEFNGEIIFRGRSPFSNSVSKSFNSAISAMTIQISHFRIFRTFKDGNLHAEFLVVVSIGSASPVTFGVWKRHSDFRELSNGLKSQYNPDAYKNALLSWDCVLQRKRWFKCLDKDYLALKCFLLERYMHDLLFESSEPTVITNFLELKSIR